MVVNEVLQWLSLAAILVLLVGAYRQIAVMLGIDRGKAVLDSGGFAVGRKLPPLARQKLERILDTDSIEDANAVLVFVSERCGGCARLLAEMTEAADSGCLPSDIIIVSRSGSQPFLKSLHEITDNVGLDEDLELARSLNVQQTPFAFGLSGGQSSEPQRPVRTLEDLTEHHQQIHTIANEKGE